MGPDSVPLVTPRTSPLHDRHVAAGAKLADFSGWSMPTEHAAVRGGVGLFDVSHLGTGTVRGPGAAEFVNRCLSNDLGKIGPGQAQYTLCCLPDGGGDGAPECEDRDQKRRAHTRWRTPIARFRASHAAEPAPGVKISP